MPKKTPRSLAANRARLSHKVSYALKNPARVDSFVRRALRDRWLRLSTPITSTTTAP